MLFIRIRSLHGDILGRIMETNNGLNHRAIMQMSSMMLKCSFCHFELSNAHPCSVYEKEPCKYSKRRRKCGFAFNRTEKPYTFGKTFEPIVVAGFTQCLAGPRRYFVVISHGLIRLVYIVDQLDYQMLGLLDHLTKDTTGSGKHQNPA